MYIDSHSHLYLEQFDADRDEVIERMKTSRVDKVLLPNIDAGTVKPMLSLRKNYPDVCYPMIGLHPGSVKDNFREELNNIEKWIGKEDFIAIGETGIDLYWDTTYREEQELVFRKQLEWAKNLNLPIVIHSRESFKEIFSVLDTERTNGLSGVFHSFTGGEPELKKILEYETFYIGINGIVSFKNSNLADVVAGIPTEKLLLETDSPFLAPVPKRGKRNESSFLPYIGQKLAGIFDVSEEKIAEITTENAQRLFKLDE